jgi:1-acyl-sn-glycerol-3-phosphate acyltransferase
MKKLVGALRFFGFVIVSIIFAMMEIFTLPLHRGGRLFHRLARGWARVALFTCGINVKVKGLEKLDPTRHYIYVSNHASMFDIPALIAGIPDQIRIVYKKELEVIPIFGWGLKWGSYIGIDRSGKPGAVKSLKQAARKIREGASVLLYAEGTRTLDGKLQPFKRGAFNLALKAGVPVVPLTINGTFNILHKRSINVQPGVAELILESPIEINGRGGKDAELKLAEQVHSVIRKHYIDQ